MITGSTPIWGTHPFVSYTGYHFVAIFKYPSKNTKKQQQSFSSKVQFSSWRGAVRRVSAAFNRNLEKRNVTSAFDVWLIWTLGPPEIRYTYQKIWKHDSKCLTPFLEKFQILQMTNITCDDSRLLRCVAQQAHIFSVRLKKWVGLKTEKV